MQNTAAPASGAQRKSSAIDLETLAAAAKKAAELSLPLGTTGDDGGSANFDTAVLFVPRQSRAVEAALAPLRPSWRERSGPWPQGYALRGEVQGQGYRVTRVAECIAKTMREAGFKVVVRYELD